MALSNPTLGAATSATAASGITSRVTGTISPSSNCLLYVYGAVDGDGSETFTVTTTLANVGTWTVHRRTLQSPANGTNFFVAYALVTGAPGSGTITVSISGSNADLAVIRPGWLTGHNTTTPLAQAIVSATGSASTALATLGATPAAANERLGFICRFTSTNAAATITPGSGTEAGQDFVWNATYSFGVEIESQYQNGSSPAAAMSATALGTFDAWGAIVLEVADPTPVAPAQVAGVTAVPASTTSVAVAWTAPFNGGSAITDYLYERAPDVSGSPGTYVSLSHSASTSTTFTDTGLSLGGIYWYRISAINAIGTGTASTAVQARLTVFTDDFSGGLGNWVLSRWRSAQPDTAGDPMHVVPVSDVSGSLDGLTNQLPPNDVFIGTGTKVFIGGGAQNYGDTVLRCNQQMDFSSGTGVIRLNTVIGPHDVLQGWTHLYVTDIPVNAPSAEEGNNKGPIPVSGFDIRLNYGQNSPDGGAHIYPSPAVLTYNAGVESSIITDTNAAHAAPVSATALTDVIITFTHSTISITADGVLWFSSSWTIPAGMTQGWVYFGAHNHASRKYTPFNDSFNAVIKSVQFDGAPIAPQLTYKVADRLNSHSSSPEPAGMDMGWNTPVTSLTIPSVPAGVTSAKLLLSYHIDPIANAGPFAVTYSLNGNSTRTVTLPSGSSSTGGYGVSGSGMMTAQVTVADLVTGNNTIDVNLTGNTGGYAAFVGNIHLLVETTAAGKAPALSRRRPQRALMRRAA